MIIEQIYTGCLAQGAYYIQSGNEAAIIDPLREINPYLERAKAKNAVIKYVFETHFHADFVSGHIDLAKETGATIVYGPGANPSFDALIAEDNQEFTLGTCTIKVLHTPGHTLESVCYLFLDQDGNERALFSGDTLFIGDVGRPDLAQKAAHLTQEQLAEKLFDSLRAKIMPLNDQLVVYPAHGAGSACGKNMSKETTDTLGHQKQTNYALRADMTKDEFVKEVTAGLTPPPAYFPLNVKMNREGYESFEKVLKKGMHALSSDDFERVANETGAVLLDTRDSEIFAAGFIPNAINIGVNGNFAPWVGALIPDIKQEILLITEPDKEEEVITRLSRVGYDQAIGFLKGGMEAWKMAGKEVDQIESVTADQIALQAENEQPDWLDVRKESEFCAEHLVNATNTPLDYLNDAMSQVNRNKTYYVHCESGYRSMIFNSILRARGYDKLINVKGGFKALKESGEFEISPFVCPSTVKQP